MKLFIAMLVSAGIGVCAPADKGWEKLSALKPGDPVEVAARDHSAKGEFAASSTESLTIRTNGREEKFFVRTWFGLCPARPVTESGMC